MKQYRMVRIAGLHHRKPMLDFYAANPGITEKCYSEQQRALFQHAYVYADGFSRSMRSLGHEAHEIVFDLEPLQKSWASENGVIFDPMQWRTQILLHQIERIKPDVLYFQDIHSLPYDVRNNLKKQFPFIKLVAVYKGFPGEFKELENVDILFASAPRMVQQFTDAGLKCHLLYHSFDASVLEKLQKNLEESPQTHGFTFLGSSGHGYGGHRCRFWMLVELIRKTDIELWVDDREGYPKDGLDKLPSFIKRAFEEQYGGIHALGELPPQPLKEMCPDRCHDAVFGMDMFKILQRSKITFNRHTEAILDNVANIRLFQATGVGTCLLTDTGTNMPDLFEDGTEVVTYSTIEECVEKVAYLLDHETERKKIAAAGQRRTLKNHSVLNRCQQIDDIIQLTL